MRAVRHIGVVFVVGLMLGPPAPASAAAEATMDSPRYALQTCVWPARYDRCIDKCEWKKRQHEKHGDCYISLEDDGTSTCREREASSVWACVLRCKADYCPQYRP